MFNMGLLSNIARARAGFRAAGAAVPVLLSQAFGRNVKRIYDESTKNLQDMVYDQPPTPYYVRTGNLMTGHKLRRAGVFTWIIYNEEDYASYVHDGTSRMPPRPWIQNAIDSGMVGTNERIVNEVSEGARFDSGPAE